MSAIRMTEADYEAHQRRIKGPCIPIASAAALAKFPKPPAPKKESPLEVEFLRQLRESGLPPMVREHRPIEGRKFRLDFAYVETKLAVEIQGDVHRRKADKWKRDMEKLNLLQINGWVVLHLCRDHLLSGEAIKWLRQLSEGKP